MSRPRDEGSARDHPLPRFPLHHASHGPPLPRGRGERVTVSTAPDRPPDGPRRRPQQTVSRTTRHVEHRLPLRARGWPVVDVAGRGDQPTHLFGGRRLDRPAPAARPTPRHVCSGPRSSAERGSRTPWPVVEQDAKGPPLAELWRRPAQLSEDPRRISFGAVNHPRTAAGRRRHLHVADTGPPLHHRPLVPATPRHSQRRERSSDLHTIGTQQRTRPLPNLGKGL